MLPGGRGESSVEQGDFQTFSSSSHNKALLTGRFRPEYRRCAVVLLNNNCHSAVISTIRTIISTVVTNSVITVHFNFAALSSGIPRGYREQWFTILQ
jgi:hypothetical protein